MEALSIGEFGVLLFVGKDIDHDFKEYQQDQKEGWLLELESDKCTDNDRDVHDYDSLVGLEKKILEGYSLVFFVPDKVISVGNPVASEETKCCKEEA